MFRKHGVLLATHRGYDPGALVMARALARSFAAPLVTSTVSRLLVDLNRSIGHPRLFSEATHGAPRQLRTEIVERHYKPYRSQVEQLVARSVARGRRVVHVSSHSFTPSLEGKVRNADVGLLYDPARRGEVRICDRWKHCLARLTPQLRVRRNYPYEGKGDGLTKYLRARFPQEAYVGIELEINQAIVFAAGRPWAALRATLIESLRMACHTDTGEP